MVGSEIIQDIGLTTKFVHSLQYFVSSGKSQTREKGEVLSSLGSSRITLLKLETQRKYVLVLEIRFEMRFGMVDSGR